VMMESQTVPPRTRVWMGKCVDLGGIYGVASDASETAARTGGEATAYVTTFAFDGVALQVVTIRPPTGVPSGTRITTEVTDHPWEDCLVSLWPAGDDLIHWPPRLGLNGEAGLETLRCRFRVDE
jgi:hypothetical protein